MNWMQFVSALVDSAAWPLSAVACLLLLRDHLSTLVPRLERVKAFGGEAEFGPALDRVALSLERAQESDAATAALDPNEDEPGLNDKDSRQTRSTGLSDAAPAQELTQRASLLAAVSPRASILDTWFSVESTLKRLADLPGSMPDLPLHRLLEALRGELTPEWLIAINDLRMLRNRVAHSEEPSVTAPVALDYADAAARVIAHLDALGRRRSEWDSFPDGVDGPAALSALEALSDAAYDYFERLAADARRNDPEVEGCFFPAHDSATDELVEQGLSVVVDAPYADVPGKRFFRLTQRGHAAARLVTVRHPIPSYARGRLRAAEAGRGVARTRQGD